MDEDELFDPRNFFVESNKPPPKRSRRSKRKDEEFVPITRSRRLAEKEQDEDTDVEPLPKSIVTQTPYVFFDANEVVARMRQAAEDYERERKRLKQATVVQPPLPVVQPPPPAQPKPVVQPTPPAQLRPIVSTPPESPPSVSSPESPRSVASDPLLLPILESIPQLGEEELPILDDSFRLSGRWRFIESPVPRAPAKPDRKIWTRVISEDQLISSLGLITLQEWLDPYRGTFRVRYLKYPAPPHEQLPYAETLHVVDTFYRKALLDTYTKLFRDRSERMIELAEEYDEDNFLEVDDDVLAISCRIADIYRISLEEFHWLKWMKSKYTQPQPQQTNNTSWSTFTFDWLAQSQELDIDLIWAMEVRMYTFRIDVLPFSRQSPNAHKQQIRRAYNVSKGEREC